MTLSNKLLCYLSHQFQSYLFNVIHDEIMLEVPDALVDAAKTELQRTMLAAADYMLSPYNIPAEALPSSSKCVTSHDNILLFI